MSEAFETLANILGRERLNAYAVEQHLAKDDPGWVGPLQMIPLLDAVREERAKIETAAASLPDAMRIAGSEIVKGLAADVADQTAKATAAAVAKTAGEQIEQLVEAGSGSLRAHLEEHDRRVSIMHVAQSKAGTALNDAAAAATQATAQLRDMQLWTFVIAIVLCLGLAAGSAFVGYRLAYESAYPSGYAAGAAVERYSLQHHR